MTTHHILIGTGLAALIALPGFAQDLALPRGAEETLNVVQDQGAYAVPLGPWSFDDGVPTQRVEGQVRAQSWRVPGGGATPFQLLKPLRDQLTEAGFDILLDCSADVCGGFDFRFATLVLPAPGMFVDLAGYHFVSARSPAGDVATVLTSRDDWAGYIQIIRVGEDLGITQTEGPAVDTQVTPSPSVEAGVPATDAAPVQTPVEGLIAKLEQQGHVILTDMMFKSGSSTLRAGSIASLDQIAAYLAARPERRILFVGHTDAVGSLSSNQALSRKRAQAAVTYLRQTHKTRKSQIGADGVGYLAPMTTNLTPQWRDANRRVEAVLISTE
ncbi:MAG: OmpA family protein [Pelagimonas sp.]